MSPAARLSLSLLLQNLQIYKHDMLSVVSDCNNRVLRDGRRCAKVGFEELLVAEVESVSSVWIAVRQRLVYEDHSVRKSVV